MRFRGSLQLLSTLAITSVLAGCFDSASNDGYYPGLPDNSVPPSASTFAVGGDVSGTLAKISVDKVGSLSTAQIEGAFGTVDAATDANQASKLVIRDAKGGFAAGAITATTISGALTGNASSASVAGYSTGQLGSDLTVIGPLAGFSGGDTFRVVSAVGNFDGNTMPTAVANGTRVTLAFTGTSVTLKADTKLKLKDSGTYRTVASGSDSFTFVYTTGSPGSWMEISRSVAASQVVASIAAGPTAVNTAMATTLVYDSITTDLLGEYDNTTGTFTVRQGGFYSINTSFTTNATDWSDGDWCRLDIKVNDGVTTVNRLTDRHYPTAAGASVASSPCRLNAVGTVQLMPGDAITAVITFNRAAAGLGVQIPAVEGTLNRFEITRQ